MWFVVSAFSGRREELQYIITHQQGTIKLAMEHTHKLLYLFRGWIAFVAFMDFGTAFRSFIERKSFLGDTSTSMFVEGTFDYYYLSSGNASKHSSLFRRLHSVPDPWDVLADEGSVSGALHPVHPL